MVFQNFHMENELIDPFLIVAIPQRLDTFLIYFEVWMIVVEYDIQKIFYVLKINSHFPTLNSRN